ncbi:hypothetical protein A5893_02265 [Pedobacter psychrophilus]|uniref:HTH cro/C1-type domain-containing protein n=1 Tax=Pedobacter psychrophilus TaxID=1826909 RepID=A0A179DM26_9SPHI|nr:type II toxin-antitoxin system antitoxin SocA domain-containing protein [Pedobacter psychrophilus]OAQ41964.1 hypothetical protein A5893_02265 [Pedobacter psychrophilus]
MKSPITGKEMLLQRALDTLLYKKEKFHVVYHYYLCKDSGEQFTDDQLDTLNITQVYNQYREKYRIPFPEEMKQIREKYGVSAFKMSEILGLGANTYRLYENGEMPSVSNGRLILSVKEPSEFIKQVEASEHLLTAKESDKYITVAKEVQKRETVNIWNMIFNEQIFYHQEPNEFTGYKLPELNKISNLIAFFCENTTNLYKTKLNKLLFYADFLNFKNTGYSITGMSYKAIPYGPVPSEYERLYIRLSDDQQISIQPKYFNDFCAEEFKALSNFKENVFSKEEIEVIWKVVNSLGKLGTKKVVDISHEEKAWTENQADKNFISYQKYAFDVIGIIMD